MSIVYYTQERDARWDIFLLYSGGWMPNDYCLLYPGEGCPMGYFLLYSGGWMPHEFVYYIQE